MREVVTKPYMDVWNPITLEHIASKPMTFNSKKDLQNECRKRKVVSSALL